MILHVRTESGGLITVSVQAYDAVGTLKVKLFELNGTAPEQQCLFHSYMDQPLLDEFSFINNGLQSEDVLSLRLAHHDGRRRLSKEVQVCHCWNRQCQWIAANHIRKMIGLFRMLIIRLRRLVPKLPWLLLGLQKCQKYAPA